MDEELGAVRIAPTVITTIASLTTLSVPGVVRMSGDLISNMEKKLLRHERLSSGVKLQIKDDAIYLDLYVVVKQGVNMLEVGSQIQKEVGEAVSTIVEMPVVEVNVYVQDVA